MKILHVNCSEIGSTGKIIQSISDYSHANGDKSVLLAPKITLKSNDSLKKYQTSFKGEQGIYRRINQIFGYQYGFAPFSTSKIKRIINKEKPDIVHVHCVNGNMVNVYKLFAFLKRKKIKTVITNHAEFFYTGNCSHAFECDKWLTGCGNCPSLYRSTLSKFFDVTKKAYVKMKKAISGLDDLVVVSVSPWVMERAKRSPIMKDCTHVLIENGVDASVFNKDKPFIPQEKKTVLQVTALFSDTDDSVKGGKYLVDVAKAYEDKNVEFLVAGRNVVSSDLPKNLKLLGRVLDQNELSNLYQKASVTLLTSKRETFGMAVIESLACGTPVVGFKSGGSESIATKAYSKFVDFGDTKSLINALDNVLDMKTDDLANKISSDAISRYSSEVMAKKYNDLYLKILRG